MGCGYFFEKTSCVLEMYIEEFIDELKRLLDVLQNNPQKQNKTKQNNPQCWDGGWMLGCTKAGLGLTLWKLGPWNQREQWQGLEGGGLGSC